MTFSTAGLIGGAAGFAMAVAVYLAATIALKRGTPDESRSAEERERSASAMRTILLADIPILTGIGYFLGQTLE
jgi:hypothetical protein